MPAVGTKEKEKPGALSGDAIPAPRINYRSSIRLNNDPNLPQANESWEDYAKRYNRERANPGDLMDVVVSTCLPSCAFPSMQERNGATRWTCDACGSRWRHNDIVHEWFKVPEKITAPVLTHPDVLS